jgi:hypothetical protein
MLSVALGRPLAAGASFSDERRVHVLVATASARQTKLELESARRKRRCGTQAKLDRDSESIGDA